MATNITSVLTPSSHSDIAVKQQLSPPRVHDPVVSSPSNSFTLLFSQALQSVDKEYKQLQKVDSSLRTTTASIPVLLSAQQAASTYQLHVELLAKLTETMTTSIRRFQEMK